MVGGGGVQWHTDLSPTAHESSEHLVCLCSATPYEREMQQKTADPNSEHTHPPQASVALGCSDCRLPKALYFFHVQE